MNALTVAAPDFNAAIQKVDEERRTIFGYAYVAKKVDGTQVTDHSGDEVDPANLEEVAYDYVLNSREGDEMHTESVTAHIIESFVITPEKLEKMGLAPDALPSGWWVGFYIDSEAVWKKVKDGTLKMFSIGGTGTREEIAE